MDNNSYNDTDAGRPVSVMALKQRFEALHQSRHRSRSIAEEQDISRTTSATQQSHCKQPVTSTPIHKSPSRFQPNTYESNAITGWRKRFNATFHEGDHAHEEDDDQSIVSLAMTPPPKPQRTFHHDRYVQDKEEIRALVDQKFRGKKKRDIVPNRRRSRSADASIDVMFEPATFVRKIIRNSFGEADVLVPLVERAPDFEADYQDNAGDQAAEYARSLRHTLPQRRMVSHYSTVTGLTGEAGLCLFVTVYDKQSDSVALHPGSSNVQKPDFVKKFLSQTCHANRDNFCWFSYTDQIFIYTYYISSENRAIALSSHLFSPRFFSDVLKAVAADSATSSPLSRVANELVSKEIPLPGDTFCLNGWQIEVPWQMPQVTTSQPSLLLRHMDPDVIVKSVATLVQEKRLVFVSADSSLLVDLSKSLLSLIYPLAWDYMYWPFVPDDLVQMCAAFTLPYFVCLHPQQVAFLQIALSKRDHKVLIVNLDNRCITQETGSEESILPKRYTRSAITALTLTRTMTELSQWDQAVELTFTELFSRLLGPVIPLISDGPFCKDSFIRSLKNKDMRSFFNWFSETRLFDNFVKYWQLRVMHHKYIPLSEKRRPMDQFEMRTETFLLKLKNKVVPEQKSGDGTSGWSRTAIRKVEKKMKLLGDRIMKHM